MKKAFVVIGIGLAVSLLLTLFAGYEAFISNGSNTEGSPVITDINSNGGGNSPQTIIIGDARGTTGSAEIRGIPSFEELGGKIITKEQLNNFLRKKGLSIYVPKWVPEGLKLAAIWADTSKGIDFPIILVYSDGNDTDYKVSENKLVIEIRGFVNETMFEQITNKTLFEYYLSKGATPIIKDGELIGVIFDDAYCPTCVTCKTLPLAIVRIDNIEYWINYKDVNSIIELVRSMTQTDSLT